MSYETFATEFRHEHRAVRDGLFELLAAVRSYDVDAARSILGHIAALTGPHFRYEEESLYPALVPTFGADYIEKLLEDHDGAIANARRLAEITSQDRLTEADQQEAVRLIQAILPHVSDCEGLSIMVERFDEGEVDAILRSRAAAGEHGLDLLTWAAEVRERRIA